ncbi:MAG: tRNA uridine-5-carboxymethylaminomethyl(34) synthesis GTPase MnmE [Melioribacteraceae bacterium]|nr:tRNA uridine-5-carboxymethylaminomethyl(34) synthesis GTPase MnmE [Melioribacteraceae bacterium]
MYTHINNDDTIIALATPPGAGAISVIRISGKNSFKCLDNLFYGKLKISEAKTHTIHYGKIVDENSETIDDVLISVFKNPHSFTGEDSVEISTHGSQFIVQKIIALIVQNDVRLAEPGEFTKRSFLNGKMDLAQAEAVADVINSRTESSLRGARNQLDGLLSARVEYLRKSLVDTSSLIELGLDFAEEDIEFLSIQQVKGKIDEIVSEINELLKTYSFGKIIKDGVNVAIVGKPNVGKSSLLNYFLKEARAIVSDIPGTTRDVLIEELQIDGILFRLYDTAGIRSTEDAIEKEGVLRSKKAIKESDLVLFINDSTMEFDEDLFIELLKIKDRDKIIVLSNKIDLVERQNFKSDVGISSRTGEGIKELLDLLSQKAVSDGNYSERSAIVNNIRHYESLKSAMVFLANANESIGNKMSGEFIAIDLRNAESSLGEIIGKVSSEDILNNIFSEFCIGK